MKGTLVLDIGTPGVLSITGATVVLQPVEALVNWATYVWSIPQAQP